MIIDIDERLNSIKEKKIWAESKRVADLDFVEIENNSDWFKKNNISIIFDEKNNGFKSEMDTDEYSYFVYKERNLDFKNEPIEEKINFNTSNPEMVIFKGEKSEQISIELFIIEYLDGKRIGIQKIKLNSSENVNFSNKVEAIRLAIRVKGKGEFKIDNISIGEHSFWSKTKITNDGNHIILNHNNWYIPNTNKLYYNSSDRVFQAEFEQNQFTYMLHKDNNTAFNSKPINDIKITNQKLSIVFNGSNDSDLDLRLAVVFYKNGEKLGTKEVKLNNNRLLVSPVSADSIRLAIRVSGKGYFSIQDIIINNISYWWNKDINFNKKKIIETSIKELFNVNTLTGWKKNNKLIYHPWNQWFESRMRGQEFVHLNCEKNEKNISTGNYYSIPVYDNFNYVITPLSEVSGSINLTLYAIGYSRGKQNETHQITLNNTKEIRPKKGTDEFRFLLRVSGEGFFKGFQINVNEEPIKITNSLKLDLQKGNWFITSNKLVELSDDPSSLVGTVNIESGKNTYISYQERNNSFKLLPSHHLMGMQSGFEYEFLVKGNVDEEVSVLPMFIGYSDKEKIQVIQMKFNSITKIQPHQEVTQFRLALRVSGKGKFIVNNFLIKEMKCIKELQEVNYIGKSEIDSFKVIPPKPIKNMKMAVIFDEFTTACYEPECELIKINPDNWREILTKEQPDILMVESAWNGNGGVWNKRVGYYGEENMKPLFSLLKWCNENNIPTVFWNKEDPVHYNRFIETARKFDYIFTTDENMVPFYQEQAGHENVFPLSFAAQPVIHNPIKVVDERENKACFAGSYYRHHEERCKDMDQLLDAAAAEGLDIYDRNYVQNLKGLMPNHKFPERFQPFIKGNLKYYEIDKAYKGYKVMINVNTVKDSPTMFSRRVFEGLASGTPVISTYAKGIKHIFENLVYMPENKERLQLEFKNLLENRHYYEQKALKGIREVLTKHTYTDRLNYIISKVGINFVNESPFVTVVAIADGIQEFKEIIQQFERQKYENKRLYILIDTFEGYLDIYNKFNTANVHTFIRSYMHNYLNIHDWIDTPYVTYFDKNSYYGENYLLDLMLCTKFSSSDFIGKGNYFSMNNGKLSEKNCGKEHEYVQSISPVRTIAKTEVYKSLSLKGVINLFEEDHDISFFAKYGRLFFSSDKFNYLKIGNEKNKVSNSTLKKIEL